MVGHVPAVNLPGCSLSVASRPQADGQCGLDICTGIPSGLSLGYEHNEEKGWKHPTNTFWVFPKNRGN